MIYCKSSSFILKHIHLSSVDYERFMCEFKCWIEVLLSWLNENGHHDRTYSCVEFEGIALECGWKRSLNIINQNSMICN